jgi:hypothetical protein
VASAPQAEAGETPDPYPLGAEIDLADELTGPTRSSRCLRDERRPELCEGP